MDRLWRGGGSIVVESGPRDDFIRFWRTIERRGRQGFETNPAGPAAGRCRSCGPGNAELSCDVAGVYRSTYDNLIIPHV